MGIGEILLGVAFPIFVGLGAALALSDSSSAEFWVARACFIFAGLEVVGFAFYGLRLAPWGLLAKIIVAVLVGALVVGMVYGLIAWVDYRESRNLPTTEPPLTPSSKYDGALPGFACHAVISIEDLTLLRRKYMFDYMTPEGAHGTLYVVAPGNRFRFTITDVHGETYSLEVPLGPDGVPLKKPIVLFLEAGTTMNAAFMKVMVNDRTVAVRDLNLPIDFGSRQWQSSIGADAMGQNNGAFTISEIIAFSLTLTKAQERGIFTNASQYFGIH